MQPEKNKSALIVGNDVGFVQTKTCEYCPLKARKSTKVLSVNKTQNRTVGHRYYLSKTHPMDFVLFVGKNLNNNVLQIQPPATLIRSTTGIPGD